MTTLWQGPSDWAGGLGITATELNKISNNLRYLFAPARAVATVRGAGSDITTTSTTITAVDDGQFALSLDTCGRDILIMLNAHVAHSVAANFVAFDVIIDDTNYASTLTGTGATQGLFSHRNPTAAGIYQCSGQHIIPAGSISPNGIHTFKLRWKAQAATATLKLGSGYMFQFVVAEF